MAGCGKQSCGGVQVDTCPSNDRPLGGGRPYSAFGAPAGQRSTRPHSPLPPPQDYARGGHRPQRAHPGFAFSPTLVPEGENLGPLRMAPIQSSCPPHGAKAVCGRRSKMEDAYAIMDHIFHARDLFLDTLLPAQLPEKHSQRLSGQCGDEPSLLGAPQNSDDFNNKNGSDAGAACHGPDTSMHFFGVFDGHGGVEAARHCADRMPQNLQDAWKRRFRPSGGLLPLFGKAGGMAPDSPSLSGVGSRDVAGVFADAFHQTDDEFRHEDVSALVGTTAVIVLVGQRYYLVANCGDSRAVLCRAGQALPLTVDHKPEREDEMARVEKAGGQVWFWNGARVMGVLAMSRAIGDRSLRPYVIPDPEVSIVPRTADDSLIIIATDGLWDVVSDQEACTLAMKCLDRAQQKGASDSDAARLTATVLIRAAMDRGSRDNITVVVIDLRTAKRSRVSLDGIGQKCLSGVQMQGVPNQSGSRPEGPAFHHTVTKEMAGQAIGGNGVVV